MPRNLRAEMTRQGVTVSDIAQTIRKSDRGTRDKLKDKHPFTINEAIDVRDTYFAGMSLDYLFARD